MDLDRMLEKCLAGQWRISELDWDRTPPPMSRKKEEEVVQYFTDMAGIERIAAALFEEQAARAKDPRLKAIFKTFVDDELRHARAAELLAEHYNVNKYRVYRQSESLYHFAYHFINALRHLSAEVATVYVTVGELLLDVALLRSIDGFVDDPMSSEVMTRINRDESRHIAMDFYMTEYYASDAYQEELARQPKKSLRDELAAWYAFGQTMRHARPFLKAIFLDPMSEIDPEGERILEAFSRYQNLIERPNVSKRPLPATILRTQRLASYRPTKKIADRFALMIGLPAQMLDPSLLEKRAIRQRTQPGRVEAKLA